MMSWYTNYTNTQFGLYEIDETGCPIGDPVARIKKTYGRWSYSGSVVDSRRHLFGGWAASPQEAADAVERYIHNWSAMHPEKQKDIGGF